LWEQRISSGVEQAHVQTFNEYFNIIPIHGNSYITDYRKEDTY